jgi:hypothetical protein
MNRPYDPIDRHYTLHTRLEELYKQRANPMARRRLLELGQTHLNELGGLLLDLQRIDDVRSAEAHARYARDDVDPPPPMFVNRNAARLGGRAVYTFLYLVRTYCEDEQYDKARAVWRRAREIGYLVDDAELAKELEGVEKRKRRNDKRKAARGA